LLIEKPELLNNVKVFTNSALFKEYRLTHTADAQLGYQRITKIQEFNGAGEQANPVLFEYNSTIDVVNETTGVYSDSYNINDGAQITGDFDGDGKMDIVESSNLYTNLFSNTPTTATLPFSAPSRIKFAATTLSNNKLNQFQSIVHADETMNSIAFKVYNLSALNNVVLNYTKNIAINNEHTYTNSCPTDSLHVMPPSIVTKSNEYLEGDFNGDGLSEVLIFTHDEQTHYGHPAPQIGNKLPVPNEEDQCQWIDYTSTSFKEVRLFDLNPNASNIINTAGNCSISNGNLLYGKKKYVMDFNSDGKADIMVLSDSYYKIFSFKQLLAAPWIELEIIGEGVFDSFAAEKPFLFGDYNGDGKPDVMIPQAVGDCIPRAASTIGAFTIPAIVCTDSALWNIYYGSPNPSGGSFFTKVSCIITDYIKKVGDDYNLFYALDINKDGKTDLVKAIVGVYDSGAFFDGTNKKSRWSIASYINNIGNNQAGALSFYNNYYSPSGHVSEDNSFPIPLVADIKYKGLTSDLLMIRYHGGANFAKSITYIEFTKNTTLENSLKKVTQSNGAIVDEIIYSPMLSSTINGGLGTASDFYSSTNSVDYPFLEIKKIPSNKLVSRLTNTTLGVTKLQDFKYSGYLVKLDGVGSIGFKQAARSAWYNSPSDKKVWTVTEIDPLLRGATKLNYTLYPSTANFAFPTNLSTGIMNKSENTFQASAPGVLPYSILLQNQKSTDYLTGIVNETVYNSYDAYNLPTKVTKNTFLVTILQSSTITETDYDAPSFGTGSNYFIGRPNKITTTTTAYSDVKKSVQTLDYNVNGNVWRKYSNVYANGSTTTLDSVTLVETMSYYPNGLLKDKEMSATGTTVGVNDVVARKISYTYDLTNRFISTVTDPETLVTTNVSFHPLYGSVLVAKNPFDQTSTSVYDNWGKRTSITDNTLNLKTNYAYNRVNNIYTTTVTNTTAAGVADGSSSIVEQDILAREIRKGSKNLNGTWTYVATEYDAFGRKYRVSEPYFGSSAPSQWTTYAYDDYSRPITTTSFTGKIVNTIYNGLTVTVNDSVMSKSKTIDANGQVVSTTDTPGGTITFKYDASGNLLESDYNGIKTTMSYDNWGRKTQLVDSSSGTYTYSYNAYGEAKTEGSPKGLTTYTYDGLTGRILSKSIQGLIAADATNIVSVFTYNAASKLLEKMTVTNPNDGNSLFEYTYDPQRRLYKTDETQNLLPSGTAIFTKQLSFDTFSRVDVETTTATAFGKTSTKAIKHSYSANNGAENQIKDNATSANLWQASTIDARGNVLTASLGNGIGVTNTFDQYGYAAQFQHKLGTTDVMKLTTTFEPVLGNLTSRYNSMFDQKDNFAYDALDRLVSWEGSGNTLLSLPFNTTTDSFVFIKNVTTSIGGVSNVAGTLKVTLNKGFAQRPLTGISVTPGNKLRVKATITGKTGTPNVIVNVVMVETDPSNALSKNEVLVGTLENGVFDAQYTASDFVTNPKLTLKFVVDIDSPPRSNGGGAVAPNALFYVDNLKIDNVSINIQNYDDRGRITNNKQGYYNYGITAKPYQNTSIVATPGSPQTFTANVVQSINYNAFKAPVTIRGIATNTTISFGYNANEQRSVMYYGSNAGDKLARTKRRYYSADGSMEISAIFPATSTTTPTSVEFLTYIGGTAYNAIVVLKSNGTAYNYFYLHRDYQSSILAITNATGSVVEKRVFDPWGLVTKVQNGAGTAMAQMTFFDRGYTGHEHLQDVGLINMNARIYNPTLHRFLEADNYIQDPYNTQNYNRYGYCVNNPLKYTDVTGNVFNLATLVGCIPIIGSIFSSLLLHQPVDFARVFVDAVITGISMGVTMGIGQACATIGNFYARAAVSALAHGVFQGGLSAAQGGKFWAGFASGALSSIAASVWQGGENTIKNHVSGRRVGIGGGFKGIGAGTGAIGTLAFSAIAGGAGSALAGGNFWQGATTGLIVAGFNHLMHDGDQEDPKPKKYKGSLKSSHGEKVYTLEEWYNAYEDNTYREITTEAGYKQGLPGGPKMRYVRNPIDGNIMDMRHVSVVGYGMGNTGGDMVEHIQYATGDPSNSAYDIQDYYSNKTGAYFYQMRHSGSWASSSWAYDFKRFILTQYRTLQPAIMANIPKQ
jgi:RHS repeat-associated protein